MIQRFYVHKAVQKKILYMGCEKFYLKVTVLPMLAFIGIGAFADFLDISLFVVLICVMMFNLMIGQLLARKNPYMVEMMWRNLSYYDVYLARRKYGVQAVSFMKNRNQVKGHRTYESINRKN